MERATAMSANAKNNQEENRKFAVNDIMQDGEVASDGLVGNARGDEETAKKHAASEHSDKDEENKKPKAKKAKVSVGGDHSTDHKEPDKKIVRFLSPAIHLSTQY